jgi:dihydroxy-acid dehydratase
VDRNSTASFLNVELDDEELKRRKERWIRPKPRHTTGLLAQHAKLVTRASEGAVLQ